jgi:DNA gyrase subunit A
MIFTDKGKMYRLLVNAIPVGTNTTKGVLVKSLVSMDMDENPATIYSIYRDTDAKYVLFVTENGLVKKTALDEYIKTKKKTGIAAINIKDGDKLAAVSLIKDEPIILVANNGMVIKFNSNEIGATSRNTSGVKGITLKEDSKIVSALPIRNPNDYLAIFSQRGLSKKVKISEFPIQKRAGKGLIGYKPTEVSGEVSAAALVANEDNILVLGNKNSICISAQDIPELGKTSLGNQVIKNSNINSVSKV